MDAETRAVILEQGHLYRGTNDFYFKQIQDLYGIYFGIQHGTKGPTTSTSIDLLQAMICGYRRIDVQTLPKETKPLLLVIDAPIYIDRMGPGIEFQGPRTGCSEIEIHGPIDFEDITIIDSLEKLLKFCPQVRLGEINCFRRNYLFESIE